MTAFELTSSGCLPLDILNGVIVLLQCIFVVGLRSLGNKLIDPYGDDLEDLSVITFVEGTLANCDVILRAKKGPFMVNHPETSYEVVSRPSGKVSVNTVTAGTLA